MIERIAHVVGKLVGIGILLAVVLGLGVLTLALVGCDNTPLPNQLFLVRTLAGNFCVEASSYSLVGGCASFYRGSALIPQRDKTATICSIVNIEPTERNRCRMPPEQQ